MLTKLSGNQSKAGKTSSVLSGGLKSMVGALGIYKVASSAASLVTNNLSGAVQRFDTVNNFPKIMKNMGVSAGDSKKAIQKLTDGIDGLPTALDSVVTNTQRFLPMTGNIEKATDSTLALNNAFLASGASGADASRGLDQYVQMLSAGKVDMAAWKTMQETMPFALKRTAEAFGIAGGSTTELYEKLKSGEITMDQLNDKFIELNGGVDGFAQMAKDATGGIGTAFTNLGNRTKKGLEEILKSVDRVSVSLSGSDIATHVSNLGTKVKEALTSMGQKFEWLANQAKPYLLVLKDGFNQVKGPVSAAANAVKQSLLTIYGQFDKTGSITNFSGIIQKAADKINQFAGYVERNSGKIASFISQLPKMAAGFLAFNQLKSVIQIVASFGAGVTGALDKIFTKTMNLDAKVKESIINPIGQALSNGVSTIAAKAAGFKTVATDVVKNFSQINQAAQVLHSTGQANLFESYTKSIMAFSPASRDFLSNVNMMERKVVSFGQKTQSNFSKVAQVVRHPISSLKSVATSFASTSAAATGASAVTVSAGTVIHGAALKIGAGFKSMAAAGITGIKSLSAAMLSNPITAALVAMTAVIVGVVAAWRSNFQNIQGVVKSFASGVLKSITSLKSQFTSFKPVVTAISNVFKGSFKSAVSAAIVAIGLLVDGFRLIVTTGLSVVKAATAVGNGIKGLWSKIKGDSKGADQAFKDMKKNIDDLKSGIDNFGKNSATKAATESMKEFGKETDKAKSKSEQLKEQQIASSSAISQANSEMIAKMGETTSKITEAGQAMKSAFDVEGSTEGIRNYAQAFVEILDRFGQERTQLTDRYNQIMEEAESASGNKRVSLTQSALNSVLEANVQGGQDLQSLYQSNKEMLINNKTQEGQELTEEQRNAIQQQNQAIRDGLMEQQQLFVDAAQQKMELGQQLSTAEQEALRANLTALNNNHKEQIQQNNEEIAALEQANMNEQNETVRANNEAKMATLQAHNEQVTASMAENAALQLQQMTEQDRLKVEQTRMSLEQMGITTQEGMQQVFQHYVQSGASIEEQMTLMGVMLQQKGIEGSQNLVDALQSGDKAAVGKAMSDQVVQGISELPASMFQGGESGRQKFIEALQSGDTAAAGRHLVDQASLGANSANPNMGTSGKAGGKEHATGLGSTRGESQKAGTEISKAGAQGEKSQTPQHNSSGKNNGENYVKGVRSQKSNAQNAGREVATASVSGMKSQISAMRSAGSQGGSNFASGIRSQTGAAQSAGSALANAARAGASSVSMHSVGANMAAGVAAGINANAGAAVAAMASLVARVNAEAAKKAEIHSPSRLFKRTIGMQLSAGVAVGIRENAKLAVEQARNLVTGVQGAMTDLTNPRSGAMDLAFEGQISYGNDQMIDRLDRMISLLEQKTQVILNTGELVGATTEAYDQSLGRSTHDRKRWK